MHQVILAPFGDQGQMNELLAQLAQLVEEGREEQFAMILPSRQLLHTYRHRLVRKASRCLNLTTFDELVTASLTNSEQKITGINGRLAAAIIKDILAAEAANLSMLGVGDPGEMAVEIVYALGQLRRAKAVPADLGQESVMVDLARVWEEYQAFLRARALADIEEQYALAADLLPGVPWLQRLKQLHFCWFSDFEPLQLDLLAALCRLVPAVTIWLPFAHPAHEGYLRETLSALQALGFALERREEGERSELTASLFCLPSRPVAFPPVKGMAAPRLRQELELVAGEIKRLAASGAQGEEICLVVPEWERYLPQLQRVFAEQGIALSVPQSIKLTAVPWVREVIKIWQAAAGGWHREDLRRVTGLVYITHHLPGDYDGDAAAWMLEVLKNDSAGEEWLAALAGEKKRLSSQLASQEQGWDSGIGEALARCERAGKAVASWLDLGHLLSGKRSRIEQVGLLREILQSNKDRLYPPGNSPPARRDRKAWTLFAVCLEEYLACAGLLGWDKPISCGQFIREITPWLERELVLESSRPGGVGVLIPSQMRGMSFPWVFILGLNQGALPCPGVEHWLADRAPGAGRNLERELARQKIFFHGAVAAAATGLYLSRQLPGIDEGAEISPYWREVEAVTETLPCQNLSSADLLPPPAHVTSKNRLGQRLAFDLARGQQPPAPTLAWFVGGENYPDLLLASGAIQRRESAQPADNLDGALATSAEALQRRFGRAVYSISRLEQYYRCPFAFFARFCLGLAPDPRYQEEYSPLEKGTFLHWLLERFYREGHIDSADIGQPQSITGPLERLARRWLEKEGRNPEALYWQLRCREAVKMVAAIVEIDLDWQQRTGLRPVLFEASFGLPGSSLGEVSPGEGVSFRGRIDRIDVLKRDGETWAVVYDYKTSQEVTRAKILSGQSLQIPVYLTAAAPLLAQLGYPRVRVVGGGYYVLRQAKLAGGIWDKEFTTLAGSNLASLTRDEFEELQGTLAKTAKKWHQAILAGEFTPDPNEDACRWCEFSRCCRYDKYRFQLKGGGANAAQQ